MKKLVHFLRSDQAAIAPIVALLMPVLLGFAALGVDASYWMLEKRDLQTAADAAALAGAYELANGNSEAEAEDHARTEANNNGYTGAGGDFDVLFTEDDDGNDLVRVNISEEVSSYFSKIFMDDSVVAGTTAVAQVDAGSGPYCILSLDPDADSAIATSGSVEIDASGCGVAVNSDSDTALYLNGNVFVNVGDVHIVGSYDVVGGSADFSYASMRTSGSATADPYADFEMESTPAACDHTNYSTSHDATLNPGVYCGGIRVTGNNTITLNPGTYYIDGGNFNISGGGSITGDGVTIVLTNSGLQHGGSYGNFSVSGNKTVELHAPDSGYYAGMVVYQDRNAPESHSGNTLTGTAGITLDGVAYMPTRSFDFGGDGAVDGSGTCSKIIAATVTFHGNPTFGSDCSGATAGRSIGARRVALVE